MRSIHSHVVLYNRVYYYAPLYDFMAHSGVTMGLKVPG